MTILKNSVEILKEHIYLKYGPLKDITLNGYYQPSYADIICENCLDKNLSKFGTVMYPRPFPICRRCKSIEVANGVWVKMGQDIILKSEIPDFTAYTETIRKNLLNQATKLCQDSPDEIWQTYRLNRIQELIKIIPNDLLLDFRHYLIWNILSWDPIKDGYFTIEEINKIFTSIDKYDDIIPVEVYVLYTTEKHTALELSVVCFIENNKHTLLLSFTKRLINTNLYQVERTSIIDVYSIIKYPIQQTVDDYMNSKIIYDLSGEVPPQASMWNFKRCKK